MATKTSPKDKVQFAGYVKWYLTDAIKDAVKANIPTHEQACGHIERYIQDAYRVTASWDDYADCYQVSLFDTNPRRPTAGWILSCRHSDILVAYALLIHLHEKCFADGWDLDRTDVTDLVNW